MQRISNFILCDNFLLPIFILVYQTLCMGKVRLKIRSHKRRLGLKKIYVMNIRDLRHEYERGCILKVTLLATFFGG